MSSDRFPPTRRSGLLEVNSEPLRIVERDGLREAFLRPEIPQGPCQECGSIRAQRERGWYKGVWGEHCNNKTTCRQRVRKLEG